MTDIAERIFGGTAAQDELETMLVDAGVPFKRLGWDHYDCSLELHGVPPDYRLSMEIQKAIHAAGFIKAYVNHTDKWETHYTLRSDGPFEGVKGWRVSYPHNRGPDEEGIWVEEVVLSWPKKWFDSAYALVKNLRGGDAP